MIKNFASNDTVVEKIKKKRSSLSVVIVVSVDQECRICITCKWSDGTTTEETAWGIDKEGFDEENRQNNKWKRDLIDDEEGYSEVSSSHEESESALSNDKEQIEAIIREQVCSQEWV